MLFYRKAYRASLVTALSLSLVASMFMWSYFGLSLDRWAAENSLAWVPIAFGVQFLTAITLSRLLVISTMRQAGEKGWADSANRMSPAGSVNSHADMQPGNQVRATPGKKSRKLAASKLMLLATAGLMVVAVRLDVYNVVERCAAAGVWDSPWKWEVEFLYAIMVATFVMLVTLAVLAFAIVAFARSRNMVAVSARSSFAGDAGDAGHADDAANADGASHAGNVGQGLPKPDGGFTKNQIESAISQAKTDTSRTRFLLGLTKPALVVILAGGIVAIAYMALIACNVDGGVPLGWMWIWALLAMALWKVTDEKVFAVMALALLGVDALHLSVFGFGFFETQFGAMCAALLGAAYVTGLSGLSIAIARPLAHRNSVFVALGVCCTCLLMSYLYHCTPIAGEDYQWSVCCMACALASVAVGFRLRIDGLRSYGLVLALACVSKLVLLDLSGLDSLARAVALVVGGLICFAISALYNYAAKRIFDPQGIPVNLDDPSSDLRSGA